MNHNFMYIIYRPNAIIEYHKFYDMKLDIKKIEKIFWFESGFLNMYASENLPPKVNEILNQINGRVIHIYCYYLYKRISSVMFEFNYIKYTRELKIDEILKNE